MAENGTTDIKVLLEGLKKEIENNNSINSKDKKMGYNTLTLDIIEQKFSKYEDIQLLIQNLLIDNDLYDSYETNVIKYLYNFDSLM